MNEYMSERERGLCATCSSYVLCLPQCEAGQEWGACCLWKEVVEYNDKCNKWWRHDEREER